MDNAYFHIAYIGDRLANMEAKCVTFHQKHRLPPGKEYGVISGLKYLPSKA